MSGRALPPPLVALSPGDLEERDCDGFLRSARAAIDAGLCAIVLREQHVSDRAYLALARTLRELLGERYLIVHDRVHLARACDADAVHLGFRSLAPRVARTFVPRKIAIGFSAHADDDPTQWSEADYVFFGPSFETASKRGIQSPTGIEGLARAVERSRVPIWAIGGVKPEHVARLIGAGARGVAVLSGILQATDPSEATRTYLFELNRSLTAA